ncbi:hypothetical protein [Fulvimonas yonginensis]|uniref:Aspartyl protease n=1 Tax=Fulvimonas yonginensis TaxID=1495200 RepID=A0ABU8JDD8_9GAMM
MTRILLSLAASLLSTAVLAHGAMPEAVFKLEPYRKTVALRASVDGHTGLFVFDTAGGITLLAPDFARTIGCTPWGRLSGFQMTGKRLDAPRCDNVRIALDGHTFVAPVTAVIDPAPLMAKDAAPVAGSIALDLFAGKAITVDLVHRQLIVETPASLHERVSHATPLPVLLSRELQGHALAASVGVSTSHGMTWFELDTGNGGTLLVSQPYASLFGLDADAKGPQTADIPVAPDLHARGRAFTPDMAIDGNLGMPFLRGKVVTLDLAEGRLWIQAAGTQNP